MIKLTALLFVLSIVVVSKAGSGWSTLHDVESVYYYDDGVGNAEIIFFTYTFAATDNFTKPGFRYTSNTVGLDQKGKNILALLLSAKANKNKVRVFIPNGAEMDSDNPSATLNYTQIVVQ